MRGKHSSVAPFAALVAISIACVACTGTVDGANLSNAGSGGSGGDAPGNSSGGIAPTIDANLVLPGSALRRLAVREIEATLDTLFPELAQTRPHFPKDNYALFDTDQEHLDNGLAFLENGSLVMTSIVDQARAHAKLWPRIRTCAAADSATACLGRFYDEWAPRILRRPGIEDERKAFVAMANLTSALGGVDDVLVVGLEALLRHPEFLHRVELGGDVGTPRTLTAHELLSRLAFFLWGEAPDERLAQLALGKDLRDGKARINVAEAMLADPRAERQVIEYHAQWLGYSNMDRKGLGQDMWNESAALVRKVVFDSTQGHEALLLSSETFVTPALAQHYKLAPVATAAWVPYGQSKRAGILGHGTFLSSFANVADTSPVKRGKNVLNRFLCQSIELPTDMDVNADAMPAESQCRQEFFRDIHAASGGCRGCHLALDGIGFGLDTFDRVGVARTNEAGKPQCKLDGKGTLDGVAFEGAAGLGKVLSEHPDAAPCVAQQVARFFLGTDPAPNPAMNTWATGLAKSFDKSGHRFKPLLLAVIESPQFVQAAPR